MYGKPRSSYWTPKTKKISNAPYFFPNTHFCFTETLHSFLMHLLFILSKFLFKSFKLIQPTPSNLHQDIFYHLSHKRGMFPRVIRHHPSLHPSLERDTFPQFIRHPPPLPQTWHNPTIRTIQTFSFFPSQQHSVWSEMMQELRFAIHCFGSTKKMRLERRCPRCNPNSDPANPQCISLPQEPVFPDASPNGHIPPRRPSLPNYHPHSVAACHSLN